MVVANRLSSRSLGIAFGLLLLAADSGLAQTAPAGLTASGSGFVENRGQWDRAATFRGTFGPVSAWLQADGWTLAVEERSGGPISGPGPSNSDEPLPVLTARGVVVRMKFVGASAVIGRGEERLEARHNWFLGNDPAKWVTDVRSWRRVRLPGLYPGVSAVAREQSGRFEYDLVVEPGASLESVVIACEGQDALAIDAGGDLVMSTPYGQLRHTAPVAWEETEHGGRVPVASSWRVIGADRVAFDVQRADPSRRLVIDPGVIWSSLLGGVLDENPTPAGIVTSANGNINLTGVVISTTFPTTPGAYQTMIAGGWDVWVARLTPNGTMLWLTYLGGTVNDRGRGIALGPGDTLTVVGGTQSGNFPIVSGFDSTFNGSVAFSWDAFLANLNPAVAGSAQLMWSTYVGGAGDDRFNSVVVDGAGIITTAGWTYSPTIPGIPPPNSYQPMFQGVQDGMVARFNPALVGNAQLLSFTFLGGSGFDYLGPIAFMPGGAVAVSGATGSTNYPTANPVQLNHGGGTWDATVSVLNPSAPPASQLLYSTYLGGNDNDNEGGLGVDGAGRITVGGWTASPNFVTTPGAFDTSHNSGFDAFVVRIDPAQPPVSQRIYSTFVGGSTDDGINDLVIDGSGGVHAVGSVNSTDFPTTPGAYRTTFLGGGLGTPFGPYDAFVFLLDPAGATVPYATYLGGTQGYDFAYSVLRDACGNVYVSGLTRSPDFPATSGTYSALDDVFIVKMDLLPAGVSRYGTSTSGCLGNPEMSVTSVPMNGNPNFGVTCAGAPVLGTGLLGITAAPLASPFVISGLSVWIDLALAVLLVPVSGNGFGYSVVPIPLPAGPPFVGITAYAQFAWGDLCASGGVSGSCAVSITIQ